MTNGVVLYKGGMGRPWAYLAWAWSNRGNVVKSP